MATSELVRSGVNVRDAAPVIETAPISATQYFVARLLEGLASLRLTVVLFALSIFLVFVGTLAQVDQGIWRVVEETYFRVWIAKIDFLAFERLVQMFKGDIDWRLAGAFYFPGGKLIGLLLLLNLTAAHGIRFKIDASGARLWAGVATIAVGVIITTLVIQSGMNHAVESELSPAFTYGLWQAFRATLVVLALGGAHLLMATYHRLRPAEWWTLFATVVSLAVLALWLLVNPAARLDDSGLRILWQLIKGTAAGVVLLAGCVMVFRKRAGIVLLHGGIVLMMLSELATGIGAKESQMTITEGETVNWSQDIRTAELALVDRSDPDVDRVTVIPESLLKKNVGARSPIELPDMPIGVRVHQWLTNSQLVEPPSGGVNPATAGFGLRRVAEPLPEATGVGSGNNVDLPSAYVELFSESGESLGTYLVSQWLADQPVEVDGRTYDLSLRFERIYHPFALHLKEFRFDRYVGTNTPKNYSSDVVLIDPEHHVDREIRIWMNNPLRYAGMTFYQSSFDPETEETTVLQVVENPGWMAPYVACMLVAIGMLAHFFMILVRFLKRRADERNVRMASLREQTAAGQNGAGMMSMLSEGGPWAVAGKVLPVIVLVVFGGYLLSKARMPSTGPSEMQVYDFAELPVAYQGRIKPYDTVARNALQILSGRQELIVEEENGKTTKRPAIHWLLDVISGAPAANDHRVFRIEGLELLDALGLEPREGSFRYSHREIHTKEGELQKQIQLARAQPEAERSLFQRQVLALDRKLQMYMLLSVPFRSPPIANDEDQLMASLQRVQGLIAELRAAQVPHAVPPKTAGDQWTPLLEAEFAMLVDQVTGQPVNPATISLHRMLAAYARDDATTFNRELVSYRRAVQDFETSVQENKKQLLADGVAKAELLSQAKVSFEVFYNQFSPFYYAAALYLVAFILGALAWLGWTEPLRRSSVWLLWFTFAVHTFALVARVYISGRPPVTNLYSSAIFIGWGCVLMALVFEAVYRLGLGNIVAAVTGFLTLLVAYSLSLDGDTFIVLQAVLDTQFWLATHVVTITLGYSTVFLAGMMGILYVLLGHVFPVLDQEARRQLTRMTYGTLCFAIFFSFVGTVLGGLWADDSWGRFWGWDPKENGALIIVLYTALLLHARWGGLVKGRGLATLAIGGNIVTTWSWFGVNELGVGLHAYGASERATAMWLLTFALSQFAIMALGAMPQRWFRAISSSRTASP